MFPSMKKWELGGGAQVALCDDFDVVVVVIVAQVSTGNVWRNGAKQNQRITFALI